MNETELTKKHIIDSLQKALLAAVKEEWSITEDMAIDVMSLLVHLETLQKGPQEGPQPC